MAQGAPPPMRRFWQEVAFVTAAKGLVLGFLYFYFFAAAEPAGDIADHLFRTEIGR